MSNLISLLLLFSISVVDASFKPNPGILTGNLNWMGNYRECMQTDGLHYCQRGTEYRSIRCEYIKSIFNGEEYECKINLKQLN